MNPGTFNNSLNDNLEPKLVSREDIAKFLDQIAMAQNSKKSVTDFPSIEVPRKLIEHYNPNGMAAIDETGYFIFAGVKVYIDGKRAESEKRDAMDINEKLFGKG